ncbi:MAG: aminotransferase class V-fold PLP-dependent enzyme [Mycoplasmatales bacterium]|nr:aminotransferase class V-fold PLP-dependent enzyme [Mycoplasmatales bacterium]
MNRKDFKLLEDVIYLDSSAGALKPKQVIEAGVNFYENYSINPHSIDSKKGVWLSEKIKEVRKKTALFSNAKPEEIIFTSGTTEGLNRIADMLTSKLGQDDEIIVTPLNHAANVIVWIELAKRTGAKLVWSETILDVITNKTKLIALAEVNNTIEVERNMEQIYKKANKNGILVVNDAAQSIAHKLVNSQWADFTVYSSNKLYGPTGFGVLIMSNDLQKELPLVRFGGGANATFSKENWIPHEGFAAREPGTPNTAGILMHGAAIDYINEIGMENINKHETEMAEYGYDQIATIEGVKFASKRGDKNIIFNIGNLNSQDIVSYLGHRNIILRAGQHCVRLIQEATGEPSWMRASIGLYTEKSDFDIMVKEIKDGGDFLDFI